MTPTHVNTLFVSMVAPALIVIVMENGGIIDADWPACQRGSGGACAASRTFFCEDSHSYFGLTLFIFGTGGASGTKESKDGEEAGW